MVSLPFDILAKQGLFRQYLIQCGTTLLTEVDNLSQCFVWHFPMNAIKRNAWYLANKTDAIFPGLLASGSDAISKVSRSNS